MNDNVEFQDMCRREIAAMGCDTAFGAESRRWMDEANKRRYSYHFEWMGLPIIQYPQDIVAMQEIVWATKPDLIIETGVARGGSLVYYASLLAMNNIDGRVLGIDIDIRPHNRKAIEEHPLARSITLIQGSSIAPEVIEQATRLARGRRVLVVLDSNHTHEHVRSELEAYAPLVSVGSYCVVMDTVIEDLPDSSFPDRPWRRGNNPKTAVWDYLKKHPELVIDRAIQDKLLVTVAPDGYLKRIA